MENNTDNFFNSEESEALKKTRDMRLKLIDDMTSAGLPSRSGDIRVLNETMNALDGQVLETAKIRSKQQENDSREKTVTMVAEILGRVTQGSRPVLTNRDIDLPDDYLPVDIVPGETEISPDELSLKDFIRGENQDEFSN